MSVVINIFLDKGEANKVRMRNTEQVDHCLVATMHLALPLGPLSRLEDFGIVVLRVEKRLAVRKRILLKGAG